VRAALLRTQCTVCWLPPIRSPDPTQRYRKKRNREGEPKVYACRPRRFEGLFFFLFRRGGKRERSVKASLRKQARNPEWCWQLDRSQVPVCEAWRGGSGCAWRAAQGRCWHGRIHIFVFSPKPSRWEFLQRRCVTALTTSSSQTFLRPCRSHSKHIQACLPFLRQSRDLPPRKEKKNLN
jgi:hypothetical protein